MQPLSMEAAFPWGLLVIEAEGTSEPIPPWDPPEVQVTAGPTALVVRVKHEQEGTALIHVSYGRADLPAAPSFAGEIDVPSGVLSIGDVPGTNRIRTQVSIGRIGVRIFLEPATEAAHVDIVIDPDSGESPKH